MQPSDDAEESGPKLTRKNPLIPVRRLCPRCLSPLQAASKLGGWLIPQSYYCTKCGYKGTVFLEEEIHRQGTGNQGG